MDHRSPPIEATLLFDDAYAPSASTIRDAVAPILHTYGDHLAGVNQIDSDYFIVSGGNVQILLMFSDQPLPMRGFVGAPRRAGFAPGRQDHFDTLSNSGGSATIMVMDNGDPEILGDSRHEHCKRLICWGIAELISTLKETRLTFWAETESLFSPAEFELACLNGEKWKSLREDEDGEIPEFLQSEPEFSEVGLTLIDEKFQMPDNASEEKVSEMRRTLSVFSPPSWVLERSPEGPHLSRRQRANLATYTAAGLAFVATQIIGIAVNAV